MHATWQVLYFPWYGYVNNIWWTVTDMKLSTQSSTCHSSYLHHTKYSPHHPLLTNLKSVFCAWCKAPNFKPTQNDRNNVSLYIRKCNILNWMATSIARNFPDHFSRNMALLKFRPDLTYLKTDSQQSEDGTSQAKWHKTQTDPDFTIRSVQNQFSTVQLLHEYRTPEKPGIMNIW